MSAELKRVIEDIKGLDRSFLKEGNTKTATVMRVLRVLGWDTDNPREVVEEHQAGGLVDIALRIKESVVFIEAKPAKQRRLADKDKDQILRYCRDQKVQLGVLTNGFVWYLYSNAESKTTKRNDYAVEINFDDDSEEDIVENLECFLSKARVRYNYKNVLESLDDKRVGRILAEKWEEMLQREHKGLVRALRNEAKNELPKVSLAEVKNFIRQRSSLPEGKKPDAVSKKTERASRAKARVARSKKEMHPTRKALLTFLRQEPSATYVRIAEALNMSTGGTSNALRRAIEEKQIRKIKQGRTCTYQVLVNLDGGVKPETNAARGRLKAVQDNKEMHPTMTALLVLLRRNPTATQVQVAEALGISDSGAYSALKRAKKQGYIHKEKHGRTCTYRVLVPAGSGLPLETEDRTKAAPVPVKGPRSKQRETPAMRPARIKVFGKEIAVGSWREIMTTFLSEVHEERPEEFLAIVRSRPQRFAEGKDRPDSIRIPLRIGTLDLWVSGHGAAYTHYGTCEGVRIKLNIPEKDFVCL